MSTRAHERDYPEVQLPLERGFPLSTTTPHREKQPLSTLPFNN